MTSGLQQIAIRKQVRDLRSRLGTTLDGREILGRYNPQNVVEIKKGEGTEILHSCLIDRIHPHHLNGDQNPSASFNVEKMLYHCYSYGGGDLFWFLQIMERTDIEGVVSLLSGYIGEREVSPSDLLRELESFFVREQKSLSIPSYHISVLEPWSHFHPYLYEDRKFDLSTLQRFRAGYDESDCRIVIPHFWEGRLVGWQKRRMDDPKYPSTPKFWNSLLKRWEPPPKYQNTPGFPKDSTLYNYDESKKVGEAIVVEAPMSVWRIERAREIYPSVGIPPAIATFGAKVTREQLDLLGSLNHLILWLDPDLEGYRSSQKITEAIMRKSRVEIIHDLGVGDFEHKDPADFTTEEINLNLVMSRYPASLTLPRLTIAIAELERQLRKKREDDHQEVWD